MDIKNINVLNKHRLFKNRYFSNFQLYALLLPIFISTNYKLEPSTEELLPFQGNDEISDEVLTPLERIRQENPGLNLDDVPKEVLEEMIHQRFQYQEAT